MSLRFVVITVSCVFGFAISAFAGSVAAKKDGVKVTSEASKKSEVILTLKKGESLESMERKGMYWQVKTASGKVGYVSVMKVKRSASSGGSGIASVIKKVSQEGRENGDEVENSRARSAVMGVRGLDESSETQYAGNSKPNLRLVYKMEDRRVSPKSLERLESQVMKELELLSKKRGS